MAAGTVSPEEATRKYAAMTKAVVVEARRRHAHELAEHIRAMDAGVIRMAGRRVTDVDLIADLIDPEVTT
ncbi:hypothetical protein [Streptomyces sp. NRRL S-378]|uniref:hypothetical protein n=1 Tax=Streptomyces sp. NRRL S-378 TaxID=1463904 RepID=UPI0004C8042E|nr:hypothetical protein [Streptomyces sp. NRRL S-378]